jgi:hypothetical protein
MPPPAPPKILGGKQSEAAKGPQASNSLLFPPSANGLGSILDYSKMVPRKWDLQGRELADSLYTALFVNWLEP